MTGTLKARVGSAWVPILGGGPVTSAGNALGIVAMGTGAASGNLALPLNTDVKVTQDLAFTMQIGRRYRVHIGLRAFTVAVNGAASTINITLKKNGTAVPDTSSVWLTANSIVGQYNFLTYDWIFDGDGVAGTWNVEARAGNAAASTYPINQAYFYIEDVGPNMYPALPLAPSYPWTPVTTWGGAWGPYTAGTYQPTRYRKVGDVVSFEGAMQGGATGTCWTMPVGFRLPKPIEWIQNSANGPAVLGVASDGTVSVLYVPTSGNTKVTTNFSYSTTA